ncbi:cupin domain-containing protein [Ectopseudomonas mendocina]|uniref:Cupin domain-containing protein n=1 Tax=Ectopseudomonas mendocina TaxID=300 RepID=A0ABZ2RIU8_ECTME
MIPERLHADLNLRAIEHSAELSWIDSPLPGVQRKPLYRLGAEQARATSVVRYAPGSYFSEHVHGGGEEFLVLEGVFEDEHGRYPAGSYVRNPPGSRHTPGATEGCVIFVRLRQFHPDDSVHLVSCVQAESEQLLFENEHERVWIQHLSVYTELSVENPRGLEVLLLEGSLEGADFSLQPLSWMRLPPAMPLKAVAGINGARVWIKDARADLGF